MRAATIVLTLLALAATPAVAETEARENVGHPAPSMDEMHLATQVAMRWAVLEHCGHDRKYTAAYKRFEKFMAEHRDELGKGDITRRVRSGVALQLAGKKASVEKFCPQIGAMQDDQLVASLEQLDKPLRKAHYLAGHIARNTPEYEKMEAMFGPR